MADFAVVTEMLDLLLQTKPGTMLPDNTVEAYTLVLEPIPNEELMQAAILLSRKPGAFIPDAGTIYQAALDLLDTEPSADEAWEHVLQYSKAASLPDASNPTKLTEREKRALDLMGGNCGMWLVDEMHFRRREFIEIYQGQERKWRDDAAMALPGGQAAVPRRPNAGGATMTAAQNQTPPEQPRERLFRYGDKEWSDPGPEFTNDQVRRHLAETISDLANAEMIISDLDDGRQLVEFRKRAGTKG